MDNRIVENYIDKVYAYSVKRTFSEDEAAELSQEILMTVIRELPKLRDETRFEPWLWGVAENVTRSFTRRMGKQRAMYYYDVPEDLVAEEEEDESEKEEVYGELRRKIAMMASMYREIIVLYYYDGLSTKAISEKLGMPEGTVTWRLSEARRKLKKEYSKMEKTALRPQNMGIGIYGSGNYNGKDKPWPSEYISDMLSKNILYHCYEDAKNVEELARLCGVPAYYVEDCIENLIKREAVIEQTKGKYRTDFVIWTDKYGKFCEENAEKMLLPIMDKLLGALRSTADDASKIDFWKAGKSEEELFYLYSVMTFEYISEKYNKMPYPEIAERFDGYRWNYVGNAESGNYSRIKLSRFISGNSGIKGKYEHTAYGCFGGFPYSKAMYDNYIDACVDIIALGQANDTNSAALAVRDGYIERRNDGTLFVKTPSFTKEQKDRFNEIVEKYFADIIGEYSDTVNAFVAEYRKLFPPRLSDEADRSCYYLFFSFVSVVIEYAQRSGVIAPPHDESVCDVLVQM